jgi:hypothetical protein
MRTEISKTFDYVVFLYFGRVLIHLCRTAILKALSDVEVLKKPSVSSETASALLLLLQQPWPSLSCVTVGVQVHHMFADVLEVKTEILKQQEKQMLSTWPSTASTTTRTCTSSSKSGCC